jgi:hypothetical protein
LTQCAAAGRVAPPGCPSAYQRTYEQTLAQLEQQQQRENAQQAALHAEASRYAAVIYFPVDSAALDQDGVRQLDSPHHEITRNH